MTLRLVEKPDECPTCLQLKEDCDCDKVQAPLERAIVKAHEDMLLRAAADRAIKRGFVTLTKKRTIWQRFRDAWWAFWHGLE